MTIELEPCLDVENVEFFVKNNLLFGKHNNRYYAALAEEPSASAINALSRKPENFEPVMLEVASFEALKNKFLETLHGSDLNEFDIGMGGEEDLQSFLQNEDLLTNENAAPVIGYVNTLFVQAAKKNATDIHIETFEHEGEIRFRIDGVLTTVTQMKRSIIGSIINRIKVISNLDISETRIPQDGRTKITIAKQNIDIRVSVLPTYHGEKIVMRLLMKSETIPSLTELGFSYETYKKMCTLLKHSYGMILITGPTGSGKSTTLHSFLQNIDHSEKNIVTVEDPVEYNAPGVNQVQVNEKVNLTFAQALRSILRQDPDVILVGEIRDKETATIAVQAAMTGHLLLSTLHTNSAVSAVGRLVDMGVDPFLVSSTLIGIMAQRLVRKLCPVCKEAHLAEEEDRDYFELPEDTWCYSAKGCEACSHTGYVGRRAIGEIIIMDDALAAKIKEDPDEYQLSRFLETHTDFRPMFDELRGMLIAGETSIAEAIRVGVKTA